MKHENFNFDYIETMCKERDVIVDFLKQQADVKFGNQMYTYPLNVEVLLCDGRKATVIEISLGKDEELLLRVNPDGGGSEVRAPEYLAFGDLSKIIDALPEIDEFVKRYNESDLRMLTEKNTSIDLGAFPYQWTDGTDYYEVYKVLLTRDSKFEYYTKVMNKNMTAGHYEILKNLDYITEKNLIKHIKTMKLRETEEYKELKEIFSLGQIGGVIFNNDVYVTPVGTDMQMRVKSVKLSQTGELIINVATDGTGLNNMYPAGYFLYEYDIDKEALATIIREFRAEGDIMDTLNGHNKDLVEKINKLYANPALKDSFKIIISAITAQAGDKEILERTNLEKVPFLSKEYTRDVIHEILQEYCDDEDLETIIHFVGGYRPTMPYYVGWNNDIIKFE